MNNDESLKSATKVKNILDTKEFKLDKLKEVKELLKFTSDVKFEHGRLYGRKAKSVINKINNMLDEVVRKVASLDMADIGNRLGTNRVLELGLYSGKMSADPDGIWIEKILEILKEYLDSLNKSCVLTLEEAIQAGNVTSYNNLLVLLVYKLLKMNTNIVTHKFKSELLGGVHQYGIFAHIDGKNYGVKLEGLTEDVYDLIPDATSMVEGYYATEHVSIAKFVELLIIAIGKVPEDAEDELVEVEITCDWEEKGNGTMGFDGGYDKHSCTIVKTVTEHDFKWVSIDSPMWLELVWEDLSTKGGYQKLNPKVVRVLKRL